METKQRTKTWSCELIILRFVWHAWNKMFLVLVPLSFFFPPECQRWPPTMGEKEKTCFLWRVNSMPETYTWSSWLKFQRQGLGLSTLFLILWRSSPHLHFSHVTASSPADSCRASTWDCLSLQCKWTHFIWGLVKTSAFFQVQLKSHLWSV